MSHDYLLLPYLKCCACEQSASRMRGTALSMAEEKHHATLLRTRSSKPERKPRSATTTGYEERYKSDGLTAFELKRIEIVHDAENPENPKVLGKGAYGSVIELRFRGK